MSKFTDFFAWLFRTQPPPLTLKYFGYVRAGDLVASLRATAPFTNIASISSACDDPIGVMLAARVGNVKLIPELTRVLWEGPIGHYTLRPDYIAQWNAFRTRFNLDANADLLLAFYIADDTTWNGISFAELDTACRLVKAAYPNAMMATAENNINVGATQLPLSVDWVGFNYYGVKDPNTDSTFWNAYTTLVTRRSRPTQQMFLVMDGWWSQNPHGNAGIDVSQMGVVAGNYFTFAKAHPEVVAMVTWIWPPFAGQPAGTQTSVSEPVWIVTHKAIGKAVTGK